MTARDFLYAWQMILDQGDDVAFSSADYLGDPHTGIQECRIWRRTGHWRDSTCFDGHSKYPIRAFEIAFAKYREAYPFGSQWLEGLHGEVRA